ncbi:hypothetical protein [Methyloversatilis sp.]|uniref:hypothetical protein n=1 Tax=Methyloversatilis sp. TaxID=2569862 RepID=UPI002736B839|nr:hypothetical protein [Methyloversatilis sp.]MDP3289747.1 hypothetical protein [Methyloversatilis sp.]
MWPALPECRNARPIMRASSIAVCGIRRLKDALFRLKLAPRLLRVVPPVPFQPHCAAKV